MKVVSCIRLWENGAVLLIDGLEASIIQSAAFAAGFMEVTLIFKTCQDAPFRALFLGMVTYEHIRNNINLQFSLNA